MAFFRTVVLPRHAPLRSNISSFSATNNFLNSTPTIRYFSQTPANMTIKAYFDCAWKGPKVEVDSKGNVTSKGKESVGEFSIINNIPSAPSTTRLLHLIDSIHLN
jgi:hypothetical protein